MALRAAERDRDAALAERRVRERAEQQAAATVAAATRWAGSLGVHMGGPAADQAGAARAQVAVATRAPLLHHP